MPTFLPTNLKLTMIVQRSLLLMGFLFFLAVNISMAQDAQRYTVKKGDTLYGIARQHGITVSDLKNLNSLSANTIFAGQELVVSTAGAKPQSPIPILPDPVFKPASDPVVPRAVREGNTTTESGSATMEKPDPSAGTFKPITRAKRSYVVQPGDTYYSIAVEYGIPAYALFAINGGNSGVLEPYETIWIPDTDPITSFKDTDDPLTYTVRKGDTLYGIARKSGTSVRSITDKNNLTSPSLRVGQVITLPAPEPVAKPKEQNIPPLFEVGPVDIYPDTFAGRITASGDPYDPARFTVSHPELAIETILLLTNPATGRSTFAEVNDRGPIDTQYTMDVSAIVARELGLTLGEDQDIQIRVVE